MESHLHRLVLCTLYLCLLIHLCLAAPGAPGTQREDSLDVHPQSAQSLFNPFGTGAEERRLLQSYIQSSLKNSSGGPEISSWEQEVFFLFRLYDYDRSGFLDGLEMMKLLSDYNSHHAPGAGASEQVVLMVDFLLQTRDLNQDGLLDPSELLSSSSIQGSTNIKTPHQEQENKVSNTMTEEENPEAANHREEQAHEIQPQVDVQHQQEVVTGEEEPIIQMDRQHEQEIPKPQAEEREQVHNVHVHQGQPEI